MLPDSPSESTVRVLRQFRIIFNAVRTHFRDVERTAGIGGAQLWALAIIGNQPGIGVTELAAALDIHQSTASNLVRALASRQLIATTQSTLDRRAICMRILDAGSEILAAAPTPFRGVLPDALERMDGERLARLELDLAALIEALGIKDDAGQRPLADL